MGYNFWTDHRHARLALLDLCTVSDQCTLHSANYPYVEADIIFDFLKGYDDRQGAQFLGSGICATKGNEGS